MDKDKKPKRLDRITIYKSSWLNLHRDRVQLPGGRVLDQYHIVEMLKDTVAAIITNVTGHILLVKTPRYPINSINWEVPAGFLEDDSDIIDGLQREILEETGYTTKDHKLTYKYHPVDGISDSLTYVFLCKADECVFGFDRNETENIKWFTVSEVNTMINDNDIVSGTTLVALLHYLNLRNKNEKQLCQNN